MSATNPFWSVMIPTYNPRQDYLLETLRSVLEQDAGAEAMQIEIIDDCSTKVDVAGIVDALGTSRVSVRREPRNLGLAGIWNRCIDRAHGEWIHILHQDDLVFPGFYAELRRGAISHPGIGAAFCRHIYCDEEGREIGKPEEEMEHAGVISDLLERVVAKHVIQCASMVVKSSVYREIGGFNRSLKHALDWEMWVRIADRYRVFYTPQVLAAWRMHSGATTSAQMRRGENIRDISEAIDIWREYLPPTLGPRLAKISRRRFAGEAFNLAEGYLARQDYEACFNQLKAARHCGRSWATEKCVIKLAARLAFRRMRDSTRSVSLEQSLLKPLQKRPGSSA